MSFSQPHHSTSAPGRSAISRESHASGRSPPIRSCTRRMNAIRCTPAPRSRLDFTLGAAMGWKTISCSVVLFLAAFAGNVSASDEGFDRAKSLYASAAYDEALVVLNQLSATATPTLDDPLSIG